MTFPAYPEYKNSGIEWLGKVPSEWFVGKLKHICNFSIGWTPPSNISEYYGGQHSWANISDLGPRCIYETTKTITDEAIKNLGLVPSNEGALLFSFKLSIGRVSFTGTKMFTNEAIASFEGNEKINLNYAYYSFPVFLIKNASENIYGAPILNQELIRSAFLCLPSIDEQIKISRFLDYETSKIDELIQEQHQLIELLNEKRQSIISNAVCRGLNSNSPMKDSGVEWLGMVPEHWKIVKTKSITTRISSGKTPSGGAEVYVDDGVVFIRSQNVHDDGLRLDDVVKIPYAIDVAMANTRVKVGDILLNITGASIGRSCVVPVDFLNGNVNQHVCVIRLRESELIPYVELFYKSINIKNQIELAQNGAAREGLNFEQIGELLLCMPPLEEQIQITKYVKNQLIKFFELISEANSIIQILNERRAALITAAVCGRIDVRNYQARS
jgi:type I restriction enzyme S subunit